MKWILIVAVILPFSFILVNSVPMKFSPCNDKDEYDNLTCTINQVTIDGCKKERDSQNNCKLRRLHNASIVFDFTPDFDTAEGDDVFLGMYTTRPAETIWPGMDTNACNHMTCPVVKNQLNHYTYFVNIPQSYPRGLFTVRFLMKKAGIPKCCFLTKISIAA
ncbi:hypothetical protein PVAND_001225 [Polypedilum vanderplanki]|uniref:MD-2-related lipid-recognition domain-containing protein n=1 Tax=Polypedilum vanderplanki TaxID=319348 RepID=A0A9J6BMQ5_POLVA|nr:hypothetical protein PVAND_001225 [Polypedilum vanderplanki]